MKSKYLKILISLILIVSLCLAFTIGHSSAISVPIVIGGAGVAIGGIAWAIANAMGVEFSLQNYTSETVDNFINPYYYVQTALQSTDFTFMKGISAGFDALRLSLAAYNAIKAGSENIIEENGIQDNTSGTIARDGLIAGIPATRINGILTTGPITFGNGGYGDFIKGNVRVNVEPWSVVYSHHAQLYYPTSSTSRVTQGTNDTGIFTYTFVQVGSGTTAQINGSSYLYNSVVVEDGDLPFESDEVNTSFGQLAQDNVTVIIPQQDSLTALSPLDDVLSAINDLALEGNPYVSVVADYEPGPTPPPIPTDALGDIPFDTFFDVYGGSVFEEIDNQTQVIDTLGQSIWDQLTRIEEKQELMVLNGDDQLENLDDIKVADESIASDVDDLVGLQTDINENLEDVITYEQSIDDEVQDISTGVADVKDEVIVIVDEMGNVIDVLEGIDAKIYAQGQTIGSISTEVGTVADTAEALQTEVETQTETLEDVKEAVEDMVPYVAPLPDIATATETMADALPNIKTATETTTETLTDTLPDIKDATETITETLPDIITEIQDATTTLTDEIPNIDDICLNIDEAPYKDLETGVDRLPRFLLPFITDLRSALGIWHYVTEWLAQISTTFAFVSGCLVGTSIMTPIYAAIAGFMCIKIYRRMCS